MALRVALAQVNLRVGDIEGNGRLIAEWARRARDELAADLVLFPELTLTGYPPEDLLLRPGFLAEVEQVLTHLRETVQGIHLVLGYPLRRDGLLYNAAGVLRDGQLLGEYHKALLPNYSVFDEKRYFTPGADPLVLSIKDVLVGLSICEDIWSSQPAARARAAGARVLLNLNASPYHLGKSGEREEQVMRLARHEGLSICYLNLVGGQDELVFDGGSFVIDSTGALAQRCPAWSEELALVEFDQAGHPAPAPVAELCPPEASVYQALVLGVRDYVRKNGFQGAVLGLSGGIDSALTLAVAVDALGADQVEAVAMPSRFTAEMSNTDAAQQARNLGVRFRSIPIEPAFTTFLQMLEPEFKGLPMDVTEENIQARSRGVVLMAISNKTGRLLLTTGNKSEMSVGYATLYGDMAGGFAPLKDVYKTWVFRLARWRNRDAEVIPQRVIERPPSAELRADQQDTDSLPPYDILDAILERYVEWDQGVAEIVAQGFEADLVRRVATMVDRNEYKRRQAPPGIKISRRAFGRDRRYPITNAFSPE